jgi:ribosome modulation factor
VKIRWVVSRHYRPHLSVMEQAPVGTGITFTDGYESGRTGEPRTANPHTPHGIAELHWLAGWNEGSAKRARVNAESAPDASSAAS